MTLKRQVTAKPTATITSDAVDVLNKMKDKYLKNDKIFQLRFYRRSGETKINVDLHIVDRPIGLIGKEFNMLVAGAQSDVVIWSRTKKRISVEHDDMGHRINIRFNAKTAYNEKHNI